MREMFAKLDKIAARADATARSNIVEGAALVEKLAKRNFEGSHARGEPHVGGDKPNVVSGTLRRSIHHSPIIRLGLGYYATRIGPSTVYGRRVELGYIGDPGGGRGHQTTRSFPYFEPAVGVARPEFYAIGARGWARAIRG